MAYRDFLTEFARAQGIASVDDLLRDHAERYSFQIKSRERGLALVQTLEAQMGIDLAGLKVLDVGCAYGSLSIELAKRGAEVVGIDISDKWLRLAELNAIGEVPVTFYNCDASTRAAVDVLSPHGPYDLVIVNDVFEHIFDTVGLMDNLVQLMAPAGRLYFKVPNGLATRHVLLEGHKKVFGISLLAPDYWSHYVTAPFHIYYRRWNYFKAIFDLYGFTHTTFFNRNTDASIDATRRAIRSDLSKIKQALQPDRFASPTHYQFVRNACRYYFNEVERDLENMEWQALHFKYRITFWTGAISRHPFPIGGEETASESD